jgi:hypothetical protein
MQNSLCPQKKELKQRKLLSFVLLFLLIISNKLNAEEIRYNFRPGNSYKYEISSKSSSMGKAFNVTRNQKDSKITNNFTLNVLNFKNNIYIVDILSNKGLVRRYITPTGKVVGAPSESGIFAPFFINLGKGNWKIGQKRNFKQYLKFGKAVIPAEWATTLKKIDKEMNIAEIEFLANMKLYSDKTRKKTAEIKGKLMFDISAGCIQQANWGYKYSFNFSNKEFAITRPIWKFEETRLFSLKLMEVEEQQ